MTVQLKSPLEETARATKTADPCILVIFGAKEIDRTKTSSRTIQFIA